MLVKHRNASDIVPTTSFLTSPPPPPDLYAPPEAVDEGLARPVVAGVVATICFLAAAVLFSTLAACFVNKQHRRKLKRKPGRMHTGRYTEYYAHAAILHNAPASPLSPPRGRDTEFDLLLLCFVCLFPCFRSVFPLADPPLSVTHFRKSIESP